MTGLSRIASLAAAVAFVGAAACSNDGPTSSSSPSAPSYSKSGTAASGGGGGGSSTTPSGPPVAPSYTARIDSIGEVPALLCYGTPSVWKVGGYIFESNSLTHLKPANGPLAVGACVSVTFSSSITGACIASEITTEIQSTCGTPSN